MHDIRRSPYLRSSVSHLRREAPSRAKRCAGFTLIEIVAVLILTTLALVFGAMLLVTSTEIFINSRNAAEDSQKVQVAMNRLVKELTWAVRPVTNVGGDPHTVTWTSYHPAPTAAGAQVATWDGTSGSPLLLQGTPLLDNVGDFDVSVVSVSSTADTITITLRSASSPGVTHTTVVHPRYDL